jgi:hypothetical protein
MFRQGMKHLRRVAIRYGKLSRPGIAAHTWRAEAANVVVPKDFLTGNSATP